MQQIVITPKVFFDLFVLCLFWQGEGDRVTITPTGRIVSIWTTVDKVARILYGLGIITKKQRSIHYKDGRLQSIFVQSITRFDPESSAKLLFLHLDHAIDMSVRTNRRRLLRDYRISLTPRGCDYAKSIEAKYSPIITQRMYIAEIERQDETKPKSMEAVMKQYSQKVEEEVEEE